MDLRPAHRSIFGVVLFAALPLVTGASGDGCGGDVVVGSDEPCKVAGCSGQLCVEPDDEGASTCEWNDVYACYDQFGTCERAEDGTCGWRPTPELQGCIDAGGPAPEPSPCVVTGCSGQLCADEPMASTCEWTAAYACYGDYGICERDADGVCGWRQTEELTACLADPREPVSGACIKSSGDACESDADCIGGGCGGELCFNPNVSSGASTCECTAPALGCGCVQGQCTWFE
jgi:hypothetical protein